MSLANRAGDLYYTFRFLKMLTTPFDQTEALSWVSLMKRENGLNLRL